MKKLEEELTNILDTCIQEYVDLFCKKHDIEFNFWVADLSGTVGVFGDYYFGFEDIRLDLETNQPSDNIFEWYEENLNLSMKGCDYNINYYSWIKGSRPEENVFKDIVYDIKTQFENIDYDTKLCDLGDVGNEIGIALSKYIEDGKVGFELNNFINGIKHGIDLTSKMK